MFKHIFLVLVIVSIFAAAVYSTEETFKCKACKAGCQFISDETKKSLCIQACEAYACKTSTVQSDLKLKKSIRNGLKKGWKAGKKAGKKAAKEYLKKKAAQYLNGVESDRRRRRIGKKIGGFFKKNKCNICNAGCQFVKDESKKAFCLQGCENFACKSAETESDRRRIGKKLKKVGKKVGGFLKKNKCKICNAGCQFVKDESRKALCLQGCENFACKSAETQSDKRKFKDFLKRLIKKGKEYLKKNKCSLCQKSCQKIKKEKTQELCLKGCNAFACKSEETTESDLEIKKYIKNFINKHTPIKVESDKRRFGKKIGGFFKKNKCKICNAGCQFVKDESRKALCLQGCENFACKSAETTESDKLKKLIKKGLKKGWKAGKKAGKKAAKEYLKKKAAQYLNGVESDRRRRTKIGKKIGGFFKKNKCNICNAGCQFVKDESKKAFCLQGCENFACKSAETTESDKRKFGKKLKKVGKKVGGFLKKNKCKICNAGCQFVKDESKKALCLQGCENFACKSA